MTYSSLIKSARLVSSIESNTSTGDLEYPGTALEIADDHGEDLFHVVIDETGDLQVLFFANRENYRMRLDLLEKILERARETVKKTG
jgi:hypothetical protein